MGALIHEFYMFAGPCSSLFVRQSEASYQGCPGSARAEAAERDYEAGVARLFEACVKPDYASVSLSQFRGHVRWRCRQYLAIHAHKPHAPPE
jgi:hypothetical protein